MPELPDLVYIEKRLHPVVLDRIVRQVDVWEPIVLRVGAPGGFQKALSGKRITGLKRRGPFLVFAVPPLEMIIHFMLAGRFRLEPGRTGIRGKPESERRLSREHCFSLWLDDGAALHYLDPRRMGKVYLVPAGETGGIPGFDSQGRDVLSDQLTLEAFSQALEGRRQQVRVFLLDQSALSAIGNAYADEILFDARIHPKTACNGLTEEEIARLYGSVRAVLAWGILEVEKAALAIEVKVRDHLKVRNRGGQPCPVCGTTIRRVGVLGYDSFFCPKCQPSLRRQPVPWEKAT